MAAEKDEAAAAEARGGLRFTVGERVEVTYVRPPSRRLGLAAENRRRAEEWSSGRVTQLWPPQGVRQRTQQAYQVLLSNGLYFYVQSDRPGRIRRDESWAGRFAAAEAEGGSLCRGKGFAVLTAQEVEALLSDDGRELLHDAAEAFGLPLGAGCSAFDLLCGCVVRRRAAVLLPDAPLYAPARIVKVHPPLYAPGSGVGAVHPPGSGVGAPAQQWLLDLTALVDGAERDEPRTPLGYLSNSTGRVGDEEGAVAARVGGGAREGPRLWAREGPPRQARLGSGARPFRRRRHQQVARAPARGARARARARGGRGGARHHRRVQPPRRLLHAAQRRAGRSV
ncbi:hypothetical protein EMIHUDRAFT_435825 [Emiliania huxleyi CCMP1516]|uniref:Uncharacterized protein n=2 Tax=Emiliania huxleyi TaxID=2903 RepID=A0A0D3JA90_EMIH1|nr:hypothetical protein EMIHUDRAFT_435825 [Emiliania huxleyi CCMP1516]EOD20425.1 hypothetical protein EMIHUDRAFT_435825 [Emiliania huxleyi CCMP1516]|eukprot:XP_005772854.1 hypothetical protein EMIHUDRAFT_435825 [Emiliania huxleyi CCMP1516]